MTFKPGETYKTRDGREARVYATDGGSDKNWVHGATLDSSGWTVRNWHGDGRELRHGPTPSDLMPPKRELWVNVYLNCAIAYMDRATADKDSGRTKCVARIRVEYAEGQFDD